MITIPHILAEDDGGGKIVGAVVFLIIWAIGAISSWAKKQQEKQKAGWQEQQEQPPPIQPQPVQRRLKTTRPAVMPPIPTATRPSQRSRQSVRKQWSNVADVPVAAPTAKAPSLTTSANPTSTEPPARPRPRVTATTIAAWMKPKTLRHQFILTEIFQPPMAMRETRP